MTGAANSLLVVALAFALYTLSTSRVAAAIRATALGGAVLGLLPLAFLHDPGGAQLGHALVMVLGTVGIKAVLIPRLLLRTMRRVGARREVEPYVSLHATLLLGVVLVGVSFWLAASLDLPGPPPPTLALPVGFSLLLIGFLLLINRRKAISQVIGFLVLENGVYVFGQCVAGEVPFAVELGILLDLLVCVFVMGIAIQHIGSAFDEIDAEALSSLRE